MAAESFAQSESAPAGRALPAQAGTAANSKSFSIWVSRVRRYAMSPLFVLLVAALAVRIIGINRPLTGTFATKCAVHAMIARNWALGRAPYHQPTIDLLTGDERSWHLMEWPAEAFVVAMSWKYFGGSLDAWGRGISIACSLVSVWLIYRLANRWFGPRAAQGAAFAMAFSPVSIIYGQSFLLEPSLAALLLTTLAAFDNWLATRNRRWLVVAAVAVALAILTKIYMLATFLPLATMYVFDAQGRNAQSAPSTRRLLAKDAVIAAAVFGLVLLPVATWYIWVFNVPHTVGPASDYHPFGRATIHELPHPLLFSTAYYIRLAADFATVVVTPLGLLLACYGLFDGRFRRQWPLCVGFGLLLVAFPLKFMAANYYYILLLPAIALAAGFGWQRLFEHPRFAANPIARRAMYGLVALSLLIALRYAIGPAYRSHSEDRGVVAAANLVKQLTQPEDPVATIHGSTIDLLYYCDRPGWAFDADDVELEFKIRDAVRRGAKLLVVAGLDDLDSRPTLSRPLSQLRELASGNDWRIYQTVYPVKY